MKDYDTWVYIFSELIGQSGQITLKNQGEMNIAFLHEQGNVCRKKVPTSPANVFPARIFFPEIERKNKNNNEKNTKKFWVGAFFASRSGQVKQT